MFDLTPYQVAALLSPCKCALVITTTRLRKFAVLNCSMPGGASNRLLPPGTMTVGFQLRLRKGLQRCTIAVQEHCYTRPLIPIPASQIASTAVIAGKSQRLLVVTCETKRSRLGTARFHLDRLCLAGIDSNVQRPFPSPALLGWLATLDRSSR